MKKHRFSQLETVSKQVLPTFEVAYINVFAVFKCEFKNEAP